MKKEFLPIFFLIVSAVLYAIFNILGIKSGFTYFFGDGGPSANFYVVGLASFLGFATLLAAIITALQKTTPHRVKVVVISLSALLIVINSILAKLYG